MESTLFKPDLPKGPIIIADDLGLNETVNDGIILALKNGLLNGASLMPNGEAFADALNKIKNINDPNIGIHLVLVEEKPLVLKNFPKNHKIFFIMYVLGLIDLKKIEKELRAQAERCIKSGIKPTFINSHQHLHLLPGILNIVIRLAREFGVSYIRLVNEPVSWTKGKLFRQIQLLFLKFLSHLAKTKIKKSGLKHNDIFIGFINAGNLKREDIVFADNLSQEHSEKIVELGCHPGFEDEELKKRYGHWKYNWQKEFEMLNSFQ